MKYYFEKLERVKSNGKEIQTKHLKKGIAAVLLNMGDIFSDGSSDSSLGSDGGVASEDNLDIEEIEKVLPVNEDIDLQQKVATRKQENEDKAKAEGLLISPLKKKSTFSDATRKKLKLLGDKTSGSKKGAKGKNLEGMPDKIEEENDDENEEDKKDGDIEMKDAETGTVVIHKKRRRKNVESKDAYT